MSYTTIYAIITNRYPNKKEALLGMLEASFGVGLICGPLAGASLYRMFGFAKTFYIYGSFFLICTFFLWYLIPEIEYETRPSIETGGSGESAVTRRDRHRAQELINRSRSTAATDDDANSDLTDEQEQVTFLKLLRRHPVYLMSALAGTTVQFIYSFMEPILAKRLEEMNLN